jgi:hypothetical protein
MYKLRLPFKDALHLVHSVRPFVRPNPGFLLQLKHFESLLALDQFSSSSSSMNTQNTAALTTKSVVKVSVKPRASSVVVWGRPTTAQLSVVLPELRPRPPPASLRAHSAAIRSRSTRAAF